MQGVYKIENIVNGKLYIGSSENITRRWWDHIHLLNKNSHHSSSLQKDWSEYGVSAFIFNVLELCVETRLDREQWYLDTLLKANDYVSGLNNKFLEIGYNIVPTSRNNTGFKHSEEAILKMLASKHTKEIVSIDLADNSVMEFVSIGYAARHFGLSRAAVRNSIRTATTCKKRKDVGFIFKEDYDSAFKPKVCRNWNKGVRTGRPALNAKPVYVKNLIDGEIKTFSSIRECATFYKANDSFVHKRVMKGNNLTFDRRGSVFYKLRMFYSLSECNDIV